MYATDTTKGSRSLLFLQAVPSKGCRLNQQEVPLDLPSQQFALMALRKFSSCWFHLVQERDSNLHAGTPATDLKSDVSTNSTMRRKDKPEVNNRTCLIVSACGQLLCQLAWQKISLDVCI